MKGLKAGSKDLKHSCCVATQIKRLHHSFSEQDAVTSGVQGLQRGVLVRLKNLQRAPELNGLVGKLLYFSTGRSRWEVDVEGIGIKSLKEVNLEQVMSNTPHKPFKTWLGPADVGGNWHL